MTGTEFDLTPHLGEPRTVALSQGEIRYRERGAGDPIVFVHGVLVNGALWRKVVPALAGRYRCIVPDWPLGSHAIPMNPDADLSPPGLARLIVEFVDSLDLGPVTLVGNDTGGALCQLVATADPERLARLVLTPCDAYENFPPRMFRPLQWGARVPGGLAAVMQPMRLRPLQRLPLAFGWLSKRPIEPAVMDSYVRPVLSNPGVRRDAARVLRGLSPRYTLEAAKSFGTFDRPVLLAWAPEDRFFPLEHAERMLAAFPRARLEEIPDSYTFVPEDQPDRLAAAVAEFAGEAVEAAS